MSEGSLKKKLSKKTKSENFEESHSAENSEKRDPLRFSIFVFFAKDQKN